jgi:hypothetical protein
MVRKKVRYLRAPITATVGKLHCRKWQIPDSTLVLLTDSNSLIMSSTAVNYKPYLKTHTAPSRLCWTRTWFYFACTTILELLLLPFKTQYQKTWFLPRTAQSLTMHKKVKDVCLQDNGDALNYITEIFNFRYAQVIYNTSLIPFYKCTLTVSWCNKN